MHDGALVRKKHLDAMLAGGPAVAQQVIDATRHRLRDAGETSAMAADRQQLFEILDALRLQEAGLAIRFGHHIKSEIASASRAPSHPPRLLDGPLRLEDLTLMDEAQAEKDIEVSRTIQLIDLKAEWELRELQALSAALAGETVLRLEANPCRPMVYARALNHAADALTLSQAGRSLFLRTAGFAMADILRDVYGDACRRLKSWGVQPLAFRGPAIGRAGTTPDVELTQPGALLSLRDRLPRDPGQPQTAALLSRLFEKILADPHLDASVKDVIGRLRASVLRVAVKDASLMSSHEHPTWNFINQIAAHASDHPQFSDARGSAFMVFVEPLIDQLARDEAPDAAKYDSALSDVRAFIDQEDDTQLEHSQAAVRALAEAEQRQSPVPLPRPQVMHQWLDTWAQDTRVGGLQEDADARVKASAQRWLRTLTKGVRCKLFLQGQWVTAHLLWRSDNGEFFMFTSAIAGGMHSMTRRALERLRIEGLATTFVEPTLMQRAVDSVLQGLDDA